MSRLLKWTVGIIVLAILVSLGIWAFLESRKELAVERERDAPIKAASRTSRGAAGETIITLDHEAQERIALKTEPLAAMSLPPQTVAYGTLQEDPSQAFALRSPIAGTVRALAQGKWPSIGEVLPDGAAVGVVEPRFAPADRVDLASKLASAKSDVAATTATLAAARAGYERLKTLNSKERDSVSQRDLQEADAKVKGEEARLTAAADTANLIESATVSKAGPTAPVPLVLERGGQVVELPVNSGESLESGQEVMKVAKFDRLLAAVSLLPGQNIDPSVSAARIFVLGQADQALVGERVALAPTVDDKTLAQTLLFRLSNGKLGLRPGMAVTAYLASSDHTREGVVIPRSAVVRFSGRAWAYIALTDGKFTRRELSTDEPTEHGWFVASALDRFRSGDRVVTAGAQILLSEELKSQIQIGEEGEGQ